MRLIRGLFALFVGVYLILLGPSLLGIELSFPTNLLLLLLWAIVVLPPALNVAYTSQFVQFFAALALIGLWLGDRGDMLGLSWPIRVFVLFGLVVAAMLFESWYKRELKVLLAYQKRIRQGQAGQVIAELSQFDHPLDRLQLMTLSTCYSYLGRGEEAELYARQVFDLYAANPAAWQGRRSRIINEMRLLAMADALSAQGRYREAIAVLDEQGNQWSMPKFIDVIRAHLHLMDGNEDAARTLVASLKNTTTRLGSRHTISPKYQFMLYYLQHRLLAMERRPDLHKLADQFTEWENGAVRNAHNPYGQRLSEILADVRRVMEQ